MDSLVLLKFTREEDRCELASHMHGWEYIMEEIIPVCQMLASIQVHTKHTSAQQAFIYF